MSELAEELQGLLDVVERYGRDFGVRFSMYIWLRSGNHWKPPTTPAERIAMNKPVRVWSQDRKRRYGVVASNFDEAVQKGAVKLGLPDPTTVTLVLEEDGTAVDEDYWETIPPDTKLILLSGDEVWKPSPLSVPSNLLLVSDEPDSATDDVQKARNLINAIQDNPASVALLSLSDLEIIKDANFSSSDSSMKLQELCIEFYVKKKKEAEAMEFVDLLKEHLKGNENTLPITAPPLPKLPFPATQPKKKDEVEGPKPIPSIVTSRLSFSKTTTTTTTTPTTGARVTCNTAAPRRDTPSPPISAPSPDEDDDPIPSGSLSSDDAYDPEDPMFSPSYDSDSPASKEDSVDSLIDKYVRRLGNAHPSVHKSSSSSSSSSSKKSSRHHRHREKRKKSPRSSVSASLTPSPTKGEKGVVASSPSRPNLDARLKIMFGGTPAAQKEKRVKDKAKRKLKKSLKQFPRPPTPPNTLTAAPSATLPPPASLPPTAVTTTPTTTQADDDFERPLSPTPSPFLSRHLYLYWHRETLRARRGTVETKTKTLAQTKPQINGQALVTSPLKASIPPLPKNLPTVPPPNYRAPMPPPPVGKPMRETSLKAEIMRNITRMHPYKSSDTRGHAVRPNADAELEISSEVSGEEEEAMEGVVEVETVRLVLDRIVEELKHALRQHLTKDLVDMRVSVCLDGTDGGS
ncbi:Cell death activator CIDE-A [Portunus trituberculatus]|uniref:Cell death activator CIDE-A n=1 Tax=Portunus trituberculatus TaxID=210409 RepID=A0A5B7DN27_PORTR|nr:Cell death activator CIDE-A [Portunus trituberculatus]